MRKGEVAYFYIVGYDLNGEPLKAGYSYDCSSTGYKLMHGEDEYGKYTVPVPHPRQKCYIYRMEMLNEDGESVVYSYDQICQRCEEIGVVQPILLITELSGLDPEEADLIHAYASGPDLLNIKQPRQGIIVKVNDNYYNIPNPDLEE